MSRTGDRPSPPRAVIHKRILDAAESDPEASMEAIAGEIGGASTELVERVLEQYGDPAGEGPDGGDEHAGDDHEARAGIDTGGRSDRNGTDERSESGSAGSTGTPGTGGKGDDRDGSGSSASTGADGRDGGPHADLTDGQLRALRLVAADPEASQREIAEEFDVTRATISRWLSDIEGFEWARRREDAARLLNGDERDGTVDRSEAGAGDEASTPGTDAGAAPRAAAGSAPAEDERFGELGRRLEAASGGWTTWTRRRIRTPSGRGQGRLAWRPGSIRTSHTGSSTPA